MNISSIFLSITDQGFRITPTRSTLISFLLKSDGPVDVEQIIEYFAKQRLRPNKTTIYRELEFLMKQDLIQELDFDEGRKRYEMSFAHHHHLICTDCKAIEEVFINETDLLEGEEKMAREKGFTVTRHMLEFFGICKNCQLAHKK